MNKFFLKTIGFYINSIGLLFPAYAAKVAIKLFSTPRKGRLKPHQIDYLNAAIQEDLFYDNIRIKTYHWKGSKSTILLVHGWESNTHRWKELIELLKTCDYNIVALDAPAHGASGNTLFNALLYSECINTTALRYNPDVIIGHSVGGMSTVFFQHKYQYPSIKKLALLGAPANFTGIFKNYVDMMSYSKKVDKGLTNYVKKHFNHPPEYFSTAHFSKTLKAKGLIIHDEKDTIIPFSDSLLIDKHYDNASLIKTTGLGHKLKSNEVYQYILDFINA